MLCFPVVFETMQHLKKMTNIMKVLCGGLTVHLVHDRLQFLISLVLSKQNFKIGNYCTLPSISDLK